MLETPFLVLPVLTHPPDSLEYDLYMMTAGEQFDALPSKHQMLRKLNYSQSYMYILKIKLLYEYMMTSRRSNADKDLSL